MTTATTTTINTPNKRRRMTVDEYLVGLAAQYPELIEANDRDGFMAIILDEAPPYVVQDMARDNLTLNWNRLFKPRKSPSEYRRAPPVAEKVAEAKTKVRGFVVRAATNFLTRDMGNGKPFGESTREEVRKMPGWQALIAARLKAGQKVKEVWTEEQVAALFAEQVKRISA